MVWRFHCVFYFFKALFFVLINILFVWPLTIGEWLQACSLWLYIVSQEDLFYEVEHAFIILHNLDNGFRSKIKNFPNHVQHVGMNVRYSGAINAHHHKSCEFESCSWWGGFDATLCDIRRVGGFLQVLQFTPPTKLTATM